MIDLLPRILFGFALFLIVFGLGFASSEYRFFPHDAVTGSLKTVRDLRRHWKNDFGLEPTRHLQPARHEGDGVTVLEADAMQPGLTLIAGLFDDRIAARLMEPDGTVVHTWYINYTEIWPDRDELGSGRPVSDWNVFMHGSVALPDGSLVFNFDTGGSLVRLDHCGNVVWKRPEYFHHSVFRAEDGTFWVPRGNQITQVSEDGEILKSFPVTRRMFENNRLIGAFVLPHPVPGGPHPNDIEVLSSSMADAFPLFEAGDIVYSLRNLNLIVVVDPDTRAVKWYQHGPWLGQHDPDFLPDGTISVFDNRIHNKPSRILHIDPVTREVEVVFSGSPQQPFYTVIRGKHQNLANGNVLITEAQGGRAFEVTRNGRLVWEFINRYDERRVAVISNAIRYDDDYFEVDDWSACRQ